MGTITEAMAHAIESKSPYYKKEIYINDKHKYDYLVDIISNDVTLHTLYYCDESKHHGEKAIQLMETERGIEINKNDSKYYTHSEIKKLEVLLNCYNQYLNK